MILPNLVIDVFKLEVNKIPVNSEKCFENDPLSTNLIKENKFYKFPKELSTSENDSSEVDCKKEKDIAESPIELGKLENGKFVDQSLKICDEKESEQEMIEKIKHSMKFRVIFATAIHVGSTAMLFMNYYKVFC